MVLMRHQPGGLESPQAQPHIDEGPECPGWSVPATAGAGHLQVGSLESGGVDPRGKASGPRRRISGNLGIDCFLGHQLSGGGLEFGGNPFGFPLAFCLGGFADALAAAAAVTESCEVEPALARLVDAGHCVWGFAVAKTVAS